MYADDSAPSGYLECNGQSITGNALYDDLRAIVGNNVPDLRGEFVRGWDNSRNVDSGRGIRSSQTDEFESHNHTLTNNGSHNHSLGNNGSHAHTNNSVGNHSHSYSDKFFRRNPDQNLMEIDVHHSDDHGSYGSDSKNTNAGGSHNHSMNNAGSHNHSVANAGNHAHTVGNTGSTETRPRNIALMYCIKF